MKRQLPGALLLAAILLAGSLFLAAETAAPKDGTGGDSTLERRSATIRYGIEGEIIELLKTLGAEKDRTHDEELLELLETTRGPKLRVAILDYFRNVAWEAAERTALGLIEERDLNDSSVVAAALNYLAEIRSKRALAFAPKLIEEDDKKLLPALVRLLGRAGGKEEEELLLGWLDGDAPTEALRQEAIRALGDIGSEKAAERLMKLVADPEAPRFNRIYACEALAKIGLADAVESLVKAATGEDPNVRAAAVEALGSFSGKESERALLEGLRDPFAKSRIAACKALAARRLEAAVPALSYKAANDPEKSVKIEASRALAAIGGKDSYAFLRGMFEDRKKDSALRVLAFGLLARKDPEAIAFLSERLALESKEKDRAFFTALARELAGADDAPAAAPLARVFLADKDHLIRLAGLEWARKNRSREMAEEVRLLSTSDPSELVRKKATELQALLEGAP